CGAWARVYVGSRKGCPVTTNNRNRRRLQQHQRKLRRRKSRPKKRSRKLLTKPFEEIKAGIVEEGAPSGALFLFRKFFVGPAKLGERRAEAREGKANDVVIAPFDARNVAAGASLNRISAGFVERLSAGKIANDFLLIQRAEVHLGRLQKFPALCIGKP